jgi:hypothetical protein
MQQLEQRDVRLKSVKQELADATEDAAEKQELADSLYRSENAKITTIGDLRDALRARDQATVKERDGRGAKRACHAARGCGQDLGPGPFDILNFEFLNFEYFEYLNISFQDTLPQYYPAVPPPLDHPQRAGDLRLALGAGRAAAQAPVRGFSPKRGFPRLPLD